MSARSPLRRSAAQSEAVAQALGRSRCRPRRSRRVDRRELPGSHSVSLSAPLTSERPSRRSIRNRPGPSSNASHRSCRSRHHSRRSGQRPDDHRRIPELSIASSNHTLPQAQETDAQVMHYTSGTTGNPKGCLLSHRIQRIRYSARTVSGPERRSSACFRNFTWRAGRARCNGGWKVRRWFMSIARMPIICFTPCIIIASR